MLTTAQEISMSVFSFLRLRVWTTNTVSFNATSPPLAFTIRVEVCSMNAVPSARRPDTDNGTATEFFGCVFDSRTLRRLTRAQSSQNSSSAICGRGNTVRQVQDNGQIVPGQHAQH